MTKVYLPPMKGLDIFGFSKYYGREYEVIRKFERDNKVFIIGKTPSNKITGLTHDYWTFKESELCE